MKNFLRKFLKKRRKRAADVKFAWAGTGAFQQRTYQTYEAYTEHQKAKLKVRRRHQSDYDRKHAEALQKRISALPKKAGGNNVLCLAARTGGECIAFINCGYFAIGIDLNPGDANRYVVVGDFHDLQYADNSVDIVFTNSLDHGFDLEKILSEVRRVLKDDGLFIAELGNPDSVIPGEFASISWSSIDAIVAKMEALGFVAQHRSAFDYPWEGTQVVFIKSATT